MRNTPQGTTFERCALVSGLLTAEQIGEARKALRESTDLYPATRFSPTDEQLAGKLVELRLLNPWQAQQLMAGRTKFNLGPYWITDSLGRGGMGQVFKGEHGLLDRVVAIKVLPRSKSTPEAIASFTREIRAQARLNHENLVRALDAGEDGNVYYLVTEYVGGMDLRKMVRHEGPLAMELAASIVSQVAAGLQHAHEQGLIHRDVKPANILVTPDGHAKLSDLGLASSLEGSAEQDPRFGKTVGTADYLSPDHILAPRNPTPAWDIYSLGCTLYYAVTGKVPFPGGSTADKARAHCQLRPLDPRRLNPAVSAEFVEVMADMMAKKPEERIQSAAEVITRLAPWSVAAWEKPDEAGREGGTLARGFSANRAASGGETAGTTDMMQLKDTTVSYPDLPEVIPAVRDGSGEASQPTYPAAVSGDETPSVLIEPPAELPQAAALWRPIVFFLVAPVGLVALISLLWLAARSLF